MERRSGASLEQRLFAAKLKKMREDGKYQLKDAAAAIGSSVDTVRRIEAAKTSLDPGQVEGVLRAYGASEAVIDELLDELEAANAPGWWHEWVNVMPKWQKAIMSVEDAAVSVRTYHPCVVPELLRTERYAQALADRLEFTATEYERKRRVELLMQRQARLAARRVTVWGLMGEAALHSFVGDEDVMNEQLDILQKAVLDPKSDITVQVMPLKYSPHALSNSAPFHLYRVKIPGVQDHVVLERPGGDADVSYDDEIVTEQREFLDRAVVDAPRPITPLPVLPFADPEDS